MDVSSPTEAGAAARGNTVWHVTLLGGLVLSDGSQRLDRLPGRAATALLARLALAPHRAHGREELIELLWPGVALDVGRNRLRQVLSTLKAVLEPIGRDPVHPVLQADRVCVRVVGGALECDVLQFERLVRHGRHAEARALYRGELLPGFYDDWIDDERNRLAALHEALPAPAAQAPGDADVTTPNTPAQPSPLEVRVQLPTYLTRLFGARSVAAALKQRILADRLVTVLGPGGSGKTRMAVEVAHTMVPHTEWPQAVGASPAPFDLIAFVSLAACNRGAQALEAISGALQIAAGGDDMQDVLQRALSGRRVLLLLDNFEQLVDDGAAAVDALLAALPRLHVLATSRRALELPGESLFEVPALPLPEDDGDEAAVAANPAVALFVERARAVRMDFRLSARNRPVLAALVRELEGMPLAIELAASRVRTLAPAAMLERLRRAGTPRLELLARSAGRGASAARHASMERAIAWSWRLLSDEQRALLSALTVFAGTFDAQAASAVAPRAVADPWLVLDALVAHSLLHRQADGDDLRFGLYQPIREFAIQQADAAATREWRRALRGWALAWARGLPRTPPLPLLRLELANLLAALRSAVHDEAQADAIELLLVLRRCLEDVNLPAEGLDLALAAVQRCPDPLLQARGRSLLAPLLFAAGRAPLALQLAEQGLAYDGLDALQRARALHSLARVRWRSRRRAGEVEPLLDEAEALLGDAPDDELRASLFSLRGFVINQTHQDPTRGEHLHAQALAIWERLGNRHAIDSGRYNLAVGAQNAQRHEECLRQLEPVIASARDGQDWRRLSQALNVRGNACSGLRRWPQAVRDYQECIGVAWRSMDAYDLAFGIWNLPRALLRLGQPEVAVRLMAFAAAFWRTGFGELAERDRRTLSRFERLLRRQWPAIDFDAAWREGEQMPLHDATQLALSVH